jgi:hypothetical protein
MFSTTHRMKIDQSAEPVIDLAEQVLDGHVIGAEPIEFSNEPLGNNKTTYKGVVGRVVIPKKEQRERNENEGVGRAQPSPLRL